MWLSWRHAWHVLSLEGICRAGDFVLCFLCNNVVLCIIRISEIFKRFQIILLMASQTDWHNLFLCYWGIWLKWGILLCVLILLWCSCGSPFSVGDRRPWLLTRSRLPELFFKLVYNLSSVTMFKYTYLHVLISHAFLHFEGNSPWVSSDSVPKGRMTKDFFKCKKWIRPYPRNWVRGRHLLGFCKGGVSFSIQRAI